MKTGKGDARSLLSCHLESVPVDGDQQLGHVGGQTRHVHREVLRSYLVYTLPSKWLASFNANRYTRLENLAWTHSIYGQ